MGGYVAWDMGADDAEGKDSLARVVAPVEHWPEMRALILVVSAAKKDTSSTVGMQATVKTSQLYRYRVEEVVPAAMEGMEKAIKERDFESFARITMAESNSFHACCSDTQPPIFYLNDVSRAAMRAVEGINERAGRKVAAYTFDAGPNAVVYYLVRERQRVLDWFWGVLKGKQGWEVEWREDGEAVELGGDEGVRQVLREGVSRVILTAVGDGPVRVEEHLVDGTGEPVKG